jgi:alpha-ketoglutaric semialdehyde dehydrogenase
MIHKVLIDGEWRDASRPSGSLNAMNPETGRHLPEAYPVSTWADLSSALESGVAAAEALREANPDGIAAFLEALAGQIEGRADALVETAHLETGLPDDPRLRSSELPRMLDQLRQAAVACRERSWCRAVIDTRLNIRAKFAPLGGPVAVFSPNNFPFAFNAVGGGDFAAAVAAGNPVIAKANPGHPGTTRLFAEAALEALGKTDLPRATVQLLYHFSSGDGLRLVSHPLVGATAFTGSRLSGMKLKAAADRAGKPIYLEMSSANPVLILPGALEERGPAIAAELAGSCLLGAGQFCTKPGLVVLLENEKSREFVGLLKRGFEGGEPGYVLGRRILEGLREASAHLQKSGAELVTGGREMTGPGLRFEPSLFLVSGEVFLGHPEAFQVESFGALSVLVLTRDLDEMRRVLAQLEGQLTGSIYSHTGEEDEDAYDRLEPGLRGKVGRLLNDKMPTGVAVSPAMNHGGPFPATGHPGFTAVGLPASMLRFAALHCYDNVRSHRLPPELKDANPTGRMWRSIDGEWTRRSL